MDIDLIYLSLGSNIGNKQQNIEKAIHQISILTGKPVRASNLFETEPWGNVKQDHFLNQIIAIKTKLEPIQLLNELLKIEIALGRIRTTANAPRIIDIDIIMYKNLIINSKEIILPHPRMHLRKFILIPLVEIASNLLHPVFNLTMKQLLINCVDNSTVIKCIQHEIKSE